MILLATGFDVVLRNAEGCLSNIAITFFSGLIQQLMLADTKRILKYDREEIFPNTK